MLDNILVVCEGNICRSPMAQELLVSQLRKSGKEHIRVESAGLNALTGHPAEETVQQLMRNLGYDISQHKGRQLDKTLVNWADLILVMETEHKKAIEYMVPTARGKVYRLGEWSDMDIGDPYRQPYAAYEKALQRIEAGVKKWVTRLTE